MFKRTANDLGLDLVLNSISHYALSTYGSKAVNEALPIFDKSQYLIRQKQTEDVINALIASETNTLHAQSFPDLTTLFESILSNPTGSFEGSQIYDVALFIESAEILRKVFCLYSDQAITDDNDIRNIILPIDSSLTDLKDQIFRILESPGVVRENYPTIKALRDKAESRKIERTKAARQMMRDNISFMQEDNAVLRDGRLVLPVKNEMRSQLEGYIQGSSQTKNTVFMEPFKLVDMNNAVNLAIQEIEIEIARLLGMLSDSIRRNESLLRILTSQIKQADFLYAFATWARRNNCTKTMISPSYSCNLIKARHPLLKEKCVPIDLSVSSSLKAVVLTGPNAGGKTVTMKTVGLFALLNQICGYIPASDGSSLALFDRVFTDIGDDQSIENHLSTFSGHMSSISFILRSMTENSLVILDELGSGTDPQEGAALARSIMEYCISKAKLTLTTSHHGVLKQFAYASEDVLNASMEFNDKTLQPTFRVISGLPGESHAIDTAKRMHLPKSVTDKAQKYMGQEAVKISSIIRGLEIKRKEAFDTEKEIQDRLKEVKDKQKTLDNKEKELLRFENKLKKEQLRDFDDYVNEARKTLEGLVKELREGEITKEKTKKVKDHIIELERQKGLKEEELKKREEELDQEDYQELLNSSDNVTLSVGMDVLCGQYKREGTIVKQEKNGKWVVAIGPMKFTFKETDLLVPKRSKEKAMYSFEGSSSPRPKLNLDLRGYRLLEALDAIDNEIEACCVHGITSFSIIHGYGDGILSTGIHKHLSLKENIQEYHFALPEDGGQGKTYVKLK